jgi:hypothetical protein
MPIRRSLSALLILALFAACGRGPSRAEALAAIRSAQPALERTDVRVRVWQDGPPWFSCAEVRAKYAGPRDSAVVRDQVGNWKSLVAAGWMSLGDSTSGPVADPGWCVATPTPVGAPQVADWTVAPDGPFPTGTARRGWTLVVGRRVLTMAGAPRLTGTDSASAPYLVTLAANAAGIATGAVGDTARYLALLHQDGGTWRMNASRAEGDASPAR